MRASWASSTAYSASWIAAAAKSIASVASYSASRRRARPRYGRGRPSSRRCAAAGAGRARPVVLDLLPAALRPVRRVLRLGAKLGRPLVRALARRGHLGLELRLALRVGGLDVGLGLVDLVRELPETVRQRRHALLLGSRVGTGGCGRGRRVPIRLPYWSAGVARRGSGACSLSPRCHAEGRRASRGPRPRPRRGLRHLAGNHHRDRGGALRDRHRRARVRPSARRCARVAACLMRRRRRWWAAAANETVNAGDAKCARPGLPSRPWSLRHLNSFVAIAEAGSFSRAAERLWIAQPASRPRSAGSRTSSASSSSSATRGGSRPRTPASSSSNAPGRCWPPPRPRARPLAISGPGRGAASGSGMPPRRSGSSCPTCSSGSGATGPMSS